PARARLPAWRGSGRLAPEPGASKGHKARGALQGIGEGQGAPHDLETGSWQSERRIVPQAGASGPRREGGEPLSQGPTAGQEPPGLTPSGGTNGRAAGLTTHIHETPENGATGTTLSSDGVHQRVASERPGLSSSSLSSDPHA